MTAFTKNDPPIRWEFKGHAAKDTFFELQVFGRPSAGALTNIIRQLELYREFVTEDTSPELPPNAKPLGEEIQDHE